MDPPGSRLSHSFPVSSMTQPRPRCEMSLELAAQVGGCRPGIRRDGDLVRRPDGAHQVMQHRITVTRHRPPCLVQVTPQYQVEPRSAYLGCVVLSLLLEYLFFVTGSVIHRWCLAKSSRPTDRTELRATGAGSAPRMRRTQQHIADIAQGGGDGGPGL